MVGRVAQGTVGSSVLAPTPGNLFRIQPLLASAVPAMTLFLLRAKAFTGIFLPYVEIFARAEGYPGGGCEVGSICRLPVGLPSCPDSSY